MSAKVIGQTLANRYREDLEQAGLGSGRHSFEFIRPAGIALAQANVEVRRLLDGAALDCSADARQALSEETRIRRRVARA